MAVVVNINKARKARNNVKKHAEADANAVKFGLSKSEKELEKARNAKARAFLDAHARDSDKTE